MTNYTKLTLRIVEAIGEPRWGTMKLVFNMIESFYASINKEIAAKKVEYENMMKNLSSGIIPKAIMQDMMQRMENLQKEIETLQKAEPPESYSTDTITDWLNSIREAPTPQAIKLLVERIVVTQNGKKIDLRVESTLRSIQKMGAGEGLDSRCGLVEAWL